MSDNDEPDLAEQLAYWQREHRRAAGETKRVVRMMRASGWTWEAIGKQLGISRQGAHQRFTQREEGATDG